MMQSETKKKLVDWKEKRGERKRKEKENSLAKFGIRWFRKKMSPPPPIRRENGRSISQRIILRSSFSVWYCVSHNFRKKREKRKEKREKRKKEHGI